MSRCTRQCCALHQAQRRAHIDIPSRETYSTVEPVFTMSSYTRQWFWCNVQHCRVGLHDVELHSTLVLVHPTAQSCRSSRCRATLENDSGAPYSAVGSVFTMSSYTRQWFLCNVQRYRVSLHDVGLHSTMVLVQRTALSIRSSRCRVTLDNAVRYTRPSVDLISTLGLVQRTAQSSRSSRCGATLDNICGAKYSAVESVFTMSRYTRQCCALQQAYCRAHIDNGSCATYSAVESVFTMWSYTRQFFWCKVQSCRVGLHDVEVHSTVLCVAPDLVSSSYRQCVLCKVQRSQVGLHDV